MKIVCDSCGAKYSIADEKVAGKVFKIRCKKCTSVIVVRGDQVPAEEQESATQVFDYGSDAIWHIVIDGDQQGPYSPVQLGGMLTDGTIDWEVYVWREGLDGWKAARDVPELVAAITGEPQQDAAPAAGYDDGGGYAQADSAPADMGADPFGASADPFGGGGDAFGADAADPFGGGDGGFAAGGAFGGGAAAAPAASAGADLFAPADPESSPFGGGSSDVVASSNPRVSEADSKMTGQRNENSVLFSLSNLQALATGSSTSSLGSTPSPMASAPRAGHAAGEGSGLIDIRALAAATGTTGGGGFGTGPGAASTGGGMSNVDDLLSIGGGGGLGSTLGAPVLAPAAQEEKKGKGLMIGLAAAAAAVVALLVTLIVVLMRTPEPVAANGPATMAQPAGLTGMPAQGSAAQPAVPAPPPGAATEPPHPNAPPTAATDEPEAGGDDSNDPRTGRRHHTTGSHPAAASNMASDSPSSAMETTMAPRSSNNLDDLMSDVLGGGMGGMSAAMAAAPAADSNLPDSPERDAVRSALQSVTAAVGNCGGGQHGVAMTAITFRGSTGRVSSASVSGQFAGTPVGSCVARSVRAAHVPRFRRDSFSVNFPFRI